ncbi:phosphoglucomutase/phosphomannomutase alpha/beta/alpha domain I [Thermincola ferriacetica]|uniref:Phosphoglucomutase n=1 Tax=Thermincola ferriacetica TaxID=281456 RepID=A0A0L6W3F9_9FIRM|nr:phosphoglucomutase/phosphomannomutase family protein [Thermincola ferriacetica]KNZ70075.1 phosphoglucomutase/phosphomannomutase alpha/beta/alpha domain I [Thermincola ferriacetica]
MAAIKFGTDGWRAIMAKEFTFENVKYVAEALARYVKGSRLAGRGVVIGYDNRFLSEHFAQAVAEVFCGHEIKIFMNNRSMPTPVTAFAVKLKETAGAVMLTASHNPPEYNGIKFIPEYAGPALPYITNEIERLLHEALTDGKVVETSFEKAVNNGLVEYFDPFPAYTEHLKSIIDTKAIKEANLKVIVDPMYGAGIDYLDTVLRDAGCQVETIHGYRDALFGGSLPEPSDKVLTQLKKLVVERRAHLGLAMDGDADRFGVIDADGAYITANQVLTLVYYHLLANKNIRGPVARSVATTHMLDRIARDFGMDVDETPVGFKYIGESMMKRGSILGGEESGGLSIAGHIPEKDGILANALIAEMVAWHKKPVREILKDIEDKYGRLFSERKDIRCSQETKERVLESLKELAPASVAGKAVHKVLSLDGRKFVLEDGSWALIRASGTEPLFRIYVEANSVDDLKAIQEEIVELVGLG